MNNLNFDDGYKSFMINNDPNKVIRFNPTDYGMIERIEQSMKIIDEANMSVNDIELNADGTPVLESASESVSKTSKIIKDQIDYVLGSNVSDIVFGKQSPLSTVKGKPLFERFLECVLPVVQKEIEKEIKAARISGIKRAKYMGMVK